MLFAPVLVLALISSPKGEPKISGGCAGRSGFPAGTVGVFAGKQSDGRSITVLDLANSPSLLSWDIATSRTRRVDLGPSASALDPGGLARTEGNMCALAHSGRRLQCFDVTSGTAAEDRPLPTRAQGIWNISGRLVYADYELRPSRYLLHTADGNGFSSLRSRSAPDPLGPMTANLFTCGIGLAGATPCWFLGATMIEIMKGSGSVRELDLTTLLARGGRYPLRDAALAADGETWLLVNDPPANPEALAGEGRHLVRFSGDVRKSRSLELGSAARAILDADGDSATVLFKDGSVAECRLPSAALP